jgi:hypothetical protein
LQSLGGSRGFERFGHGLQPSRVVRLERDEFGDGGSPTLWPTTAVGRLKLASSSRGGVAWVLSPRAGPVGCLAR